jgi:2-methylcitrate synthase
MANKGLAGMVAGDSKIATVGLGSGLNYRGYNIEELAEKSTFEEVFYLLLFERLPLRKELERFIEKISSERYIPMHLQSILEKIPATAHPMDVMRCITSVLGTLEPEDGIERTAESISVRLVAIMGPALLFWYHFHRSGLRINGYTGPNDTVAENFMKLLTLKLNEKIDPIIIKTFDVSLILYAEHDFNASTFAARVTTSTKSDFYSGITSAIGTLRGPLHGGANEAAMEFLRQFNSIQEADNKLREIFKNKGLIMGFGHRVYKNGDPRNGIIKVSYPLLTIKFKEILKSSFRVRSSRLKPLIVRHFGLH